MESIPLPTPIECTVSDDVSVDNNISEYCSGIIPINENIKQYLMKDGNCDIRNCTSKTFDFGHAFYQLNKLELMPQQLYYPSSLLA